jgi:F-type H+-transporting ATPase subunit delta
MKGSKQSRRDAKQLFRVCLVNGALDENRARQAVTSLVTLKPRGFEQILGHLHRLIQMDIARRTATVESSETLSEALRQGVLQNLKRLYGANLMIDFKQNASLLGGMRIKVGSDVYDGSVRARLTALQESF